jgi:cytochrome c oxidase subunit 3
MAVAVARPEAHERYPGMEPGMMGMLIFLASEVMFFGTLFAGYFYVYGSQVVWPPAGTKYVYYWPTPTVNTLVLFASGLTCHIAHLRIQEGRRRQMILWLAATILLGVGFEIGQAYEFGRAEFGFSTNSFTSLFFLMTGFHGAHVMGGLVFLSLVLGRALRGNFDQQHHVGVAAAALYWHFVDVVWIFLYGILYLGIATVGV